MHKPGWGKNRAWARWLLRDDGRGGGLDNGRWCLTDLRLSAPERSPTAVAVPERVDNEFIYGAAVGSDYKANAIPAVAHVFYCRIEAVSSAIIGKRSRI